MGRIGLAKQINSCPSTHCSAAQASNQSALFSSEFKPSALFSSEFEQSSSGPGHMQSLAVMQSGVISNFSFPLGGIS